MIALSFLALVGEPAATRLSLRRELGLDEGVPGDEPLARGVRR